MLYVYKLCTVGAHMEQEQVLGCMYATLPPKICFQLASS